MTFFRKKVKDQYDPSVAGYHCISNMFQKDILHSWEGAKIPIENRKHIFIGQVTHLYYMKVSARW